MDADLSCCFGRALRELGRDEPHYEYQLTRNYYERSDETEYQISWVADLKEIPDWLAHETYEVQPRWQRHFLARRMKGKIEGLAVFDLEVVRDLAKAYLEERYGR